MERHEIFHQILSLTLLSDDELLCSALARTGFVDNACLGISYPDPDDPEAALWFRLPHVPTHPLWR